MIPFGLASLMTVSMPIARRATKCLVPGASAIYLCNEGAGEVAHDTARTSRNLVYPMIAFGAEDAAYTEIYFVPHLGTETVVSSTDQAVNGTRSVKVVTPGNVADEGFVSAARAGVPCEPNTTYTYSVYVRGAGDLEFGMMYYYPGLVYTGDVTRGTFTASNEWVRHEITGTPPEGCDLIGFWICTNDSLSPQAVTFYVDQIQIEKGVGATAWEEPADHAILGGHFSSGSDPVWSSGGITFTSGARLHTLTNSTTSTLTVQAVIVPSINTDANRRIIERGSSSGWAFAAGSKIGTWLGAWKYTDSFIQAGVPYCLGFTFDGSTLKQYNGADLLATHAITYTIPPGIMRTTIGSDNEFAQTMEGDICMIIMYYRTLTPAEIAQNAAALKALVLARGATLA